MDDFVAGAEDDNGVIAINFQLTALMRKYNFPMGKWASNSELLRNIWKVGGLEIKPITQVLGVSWDITRDTLFTDHRDVTNKAHEGPSTKRQLLQATSRSYDPMGLTSPVLITGKLIFQDSWCRGVGWDALLPDDLGTRWSNWVKLLPNILDIHIPRWVGVRGKENCQIHVFCDAFERANGAVLYIRSTHGTGTLVRIVCSKNRLAPLESYPPAFEANSGVDWSTPAALLLQGNGLGHRGSNIVVSGVDWSTPAALLLQGNGLGHRGSNIVVRFNRGFRMDMQ